MILKTLSTWMKEGEGHRRVWWNRKTGGAVSWNCETNEKKYRFVIQKKTSWMLMSSLKSGIEVRGQ